MLAMLYVEPTIIKVYRILLHYEYCNFTSLSQGMPVDYLATNKNNFVFAGGTSFIIFFFYNCFKSMIL